MCENFIKNILGGGDAAAPKKSAVASSSFTPDDSRAVVKTDADSGLAVGSVTGRNKNDPTKRIAVPGLVL